MTRNIGGSLLPSAGAETYRAKEGKFGTFEIRPILDADSHGLFYARNYGDCAGTFILIAMHPNGYSCDNLAERIIAAWNNEGAANRAIQQFDYILACGGLTESRENVFALINGER